MSWVTHPQLVDGRAAHRHALRVTAREKPFDGRGSGSSRSRRRGARCRPGTNPVVVGGRGDSLPGRRSGFASWAPSTTLLTLHCCCPFCSFTASFAPRPDVMETRLELAKDERGRVPPGEGDEQGDEVVTGWNAVCKWKG